MIEVKDITVEPVFQSCIRSLTPSEHAGLLNRISAEGKIRNPFVYWIRDGEPVLIDGHHRMAIYDELRAAGEEIAAPPLEEVVFANDDEAIAWIKGEHRYRRNLTPGELQDMCDQVAPAFVEEAANRMKAGKQPCADAAQGPVDTTVNQRADAQVQDEVERQTGQRPTRKQARDACRKARQQENPKPTGQRDDGRKSSRPFSLDRDYGYKAYPKTKETKFQSKLTKAVALGRIREGEFWRALQIQQADRQRFYDICFELPYVKFITSVGFVEVTLTSDPQSFDWATAIRERLYAFMHEVDSMDNHLQYNHSATKSFVAEMRQLLAPMPDPDR